VTTRRRRAPGTVFLVGAGPGDPGLVTLRGLAALRAADVVVYDRLAAPALLAHARPDAELVDAGKAPRRHRMSQEEINRLLVARARAGRTVVRLKGGDPFVFGRGGEEAEALAAAGIPVQVVPGVTSATAAPAAAGIPVTHRDLAASVAVATAHEAPGGAGSRLDWEAIARADTVVLLMGVERLAEAARALVSAGRSPATPAAVVASATLPAQRTAVAPLGRVAAAARRAGIQPPAVLVVGEVVRLRERIGGWDARPLSGIRVLVTRTREQASELAALLEELGAEVVEAPAIRVEPPRSPAALDRAVARLAAGRYAWAVFTSATGVARFLERVRATGLDARAFGDTRVAAVGPGTAAALRRAGIEPDLVPAEYTTAALGRAFPRGEGRVLLARADRVEPGLEEALAAKGWTLDRVICYRVRAARRLDPAVRRAVLEGGIDVLTFASGGTVRAFMRLLRGRPHRRALVCCIGPVTARVVREAGLWVDAVAREHTVAGLAAAVLSAVAERRRRARRPAAPARRARPARAASGGARTRRPRAPARRSTPPRRAARRHRPPPRRPRRRALAARGSRRSRAPSRGRGGARARRPGSSS
jgi:uroporphyrinogen III methyltransferase/synthase